MVIIFLSVKESLKLDGHNGKLDNHIHMTECEVSKCLDPKEITVALASQAFL